MSKFQKIALIVLVLVMIGLIWAFWGSIFSILMAMCLIMVPIIYLINRFINVDRESDFIDDDSW